jgi:hypothetical protein
MSRRFQFSLRAIFLVTLLSAVLLAAWLWLPETPRLIVFGFLYWALFAVALALTARGTLFLVSRVFDGIAGLLRRK